MHIFLSLMGCKQTTTKPPSVVVATTPSAPVYVKSALKNSYVKGGGKTEKLSLLKQKESTLNKSVNFDEKVQVKLRTPTPRERQYERTLSAKRIRKKLSRSYEEEDDDDDEVMSISSQEENTANESIRSLKTSSTQFLQRNQSNPFWHKSNSIGVISTRTNVQEKRPLPPIAIQQPVVNMITDSTENSAVPIGNRFRIRRKVQNPVFPQASSPIISTVLPSTSSSPLPIPTTPLSIQRSLPNNNAILIEHHATFSNGESTPKPGYYSFVRNPNDKTKSAEK